MPTAAQPSGKLLDFLHVESDATIAAIVRRSQDTYIAALFRMSSRLAQAHLIADALVAEATSGTTETAELPLAKAAPRSEKTATRPDASDDAVMDALAAGDMNASTLRVEVGGLDVAKAVRRLLKAGKIGQTGKGRWAMLRLITTTATTEEEGSTP